MSAEFNVGTTTLLDELRDIAQSISHQLPNSCEKRAADCIEARDAEIASLRAELAMNAYVETIARLTDEKWLAEIAGWALCKHSEGGGPGKCDLWTCACGPEGLAVAKEIRAALAPRPPEGKDG